MAACFGLAYLVEVAPAWRSLPSRLRMRYSICVGVMALTFVFVYLVIKPASDSGELAKKSGLFSLPGWRNGQGKEITPAIKFGSAISGAFLDYTLPSGILLALLFVWSAMRRRLLALALPVAAQALLYAFVYGSPHHQGSLFVAAIAGLWIAWPTSREQGSMRTLERRLLWATTSLLICLCAVNIWDSVVVIRREYLYPYSGARDAADYLKSVGADRSIIFGYNFGVSGVQAYFDHNILSNVPTAYTHNSANNPVFHFDREEFDRVRPEYVLADTRNPQTMLNLDAPLMASLGYEIVHFSDGYYLFKRAVYEREAYFIFRRVR